MQHSRYHDTNLTKWQENKIKTMSTTDILQNIAIICACIAVIITNLCILDIKKDIRRFKNMAYFHDLIRGNLQNKN